MTCVAPILAFVEMPGHKRAAVQAFQLVSRICQLLTPKRTCVELVGIPALPADFTNERLAQHHACADPPIRRFPTFNSRKAFVHPVATLDRLLVETVAGQFSQANTAVKLLPLKRLLRLCSHSFVLTSGARLPGSRIQDSPLHVCIELLCVD